MKIKEIYHYLTVLSSWEAKIRMLMTERSLLQTTTELHKKHEAVDEAIDEEKEVVNKQVDWSYEDLVKLWESIIDEKKKIYELIDSKKLTEKVPDYIYSINKSYRDLAEAVKYGSNESKKTVTVRKATGFIRTTDGVGSYSYDVEVNTTPKYDSKYFIEKLDKYTKIADDNSNKIDVFQTNVDVDYTPRWSEHSKIEDIIKAA